MHSVTLVQVMKRTRSTSSSRIPTIEIATTSFDASDPTNPPLKAYLHLHMLSLRKTETHHRFSQRVFKIRSCEVVPTQPCSSRALLASHFSHWPNLPMEEDRTFTVYGRRWVSPISLKHVGNGDVCYFVHHTDSEIGAKTALLDLLNARVSLIDVWKEFSASDARFAELACYLGGARVLRQDPLECLIQFLCSSNNNIQRITKMVDYISSLGKYLGPVGGFKFHTFPTMEQLCLISEEELGNAGFGYRAKYITGTVNSLHAKPDGGKEWLKSLRMLDLQEVTDALCTLPGVGPKVAACIALFSLDQHHAIPVDTHVWQIATKYLLPELAGSQLTPKLSIRVAEAFVSKYGKYAGWAQTMLFIAELPSQKALLPPQLRTVEQSKHTVEEDSEIEIGKRETALVLQS